MKGILTLSLVCFSLLLSSSCNRSATSYIEAGNRFFSEKKYEEAAIQYRKAIQRDPKSAEAVYRYALTLIERGSILESVDTLNQAIALDPNQVAAKTKLGDLCVSILLAMESRPQAFYSKLVSVTEDLLKEDPNSFDGLRFKGYIAALDRKLKEAIELFKKADAIKAGDPSVATVLAELLIRDGQMPEGVRLAKEVIQKHKTHDPAYDVLYRHYASNNKVAEGEAILKEKVANHPREAPYILELARHYVRYKQPERTKALLDSILSNKKDYPQGHLILGDFYQGLRRLDEAVAEYKLGMGENPGNKPDYLRRLANVYQAQSKIEEALQAVEEVLRGVPGDETSLGVRASLWVQRGKAGDVDRAVDEFRALTKKNPMNASWHFGLGEALMKQGRDWKAAESALLDALRRQPTLDPARLLAAYSALRQGKGVDAIRYADEILARSPKSPGARLLKADGLRITGSLEAARTEVTRLMAMYPRFGEAELELGLIYLAERKFKEADAIFQRLYKPDQKDYRPLEALVASRVARDQFQEAIGMLDKEVKRDPEAVQLRLTLGLTASRAGNYDLAAEEFGKILTAEPKSPSIHMLLGETNLRLNKPETALQNFQKAAELEPRNASAHFAAGVALERMGRWSDAIAQYRESLKLGPGDPRTQNNLAYLLADTGSDVDEALRLIQEAQRKLPNHPGVNDTLGWIYIKKNMPDSARQIFETLVQKNPRNSTFRYHLAVALMQKGDTGRARNELKTALANNPSPEETKKIQDLLSRLG
jgi:tetratricopeptide (TPR) repeat protein